MNVQDKTTIGMTSANRTVVEELIDRGWFQEQRDVAKFAMVLAIRAGLEPSSVEGTETVWNVGTFDPDNELQKLLSVLYPSVQTPYRLVEYFLNAGLHRVGKEIQQNPYLELPDLMNLTAELFNRDEDQQTRL